MPQEKLRDALQEWKVRGLTTLVRYSDYMIASTHKEALCAGCLKKQGYVLHINFWLPEWLKNIL